MYMKKAHEPSTLLRPTSSLYLICKNKLHWVFAYWWVILINIYTYFFSLNPLLWRKSSSIYFLLQVLPIFSGYRQISQKSWVYLLPLIPPSLLPLEATITSLLPPLFHSTPITLSRSLISSILLNPTVSSQSSYHSASQQHLMYHAHSHEILSPCPKLNCGSFKQASSTVNDNFIFPISWAQNFDVIHISFFLSNTISNLLADSIGSKYPISEYIQKPGHFYPW